MPSLEVQSTAVAISAGRLILRGRLFLPADASAVVLLAFGEESGEPSRSTRRVAQALHDVGVGTLWCDWLPEARGPANALQGGRRNDVEIIAEDIRLATHWVRLQPEFSDFSVGYFGGGLGAPAVFRAAAGSERAEIQAVVTCGGRPDLADLTVRAFLAPTLLIVGGNDEAADHNLEAWARLRCEKSIEIIPGAGPRFNEPGALDNVVASAARWFGEHLRKDAPLVA